MMTEAIPVLVNLNQHYREFLVRLARICFRLFWVFPIKSNKILFMSFDGLQYSDSPKYISDYLLKHNKDLVQVWALVDVQKRSELETKGIKVAKKDSFMYYYHFLTSKRIVVNDFFASYLPIRKEQIVLNTWHGGGSYKTVGLTSKSKTAFDEFFFKLHGNMIDTFVSSSGYFNHTVLENSFRFEGDILECGLPRNDILFKDLPEIKEKVRAYFGIDRNHGIALYAPTFRGSKETHSSLNGGEQQIDICACLSALGDRYDMEFVFMFRAHHVIPSEKLGEPYCDATKYPNMQELLYAADVLISDYSSCMWDFSLMRKPCFVYAPDINDYVAERDFFMNIYDWPYSIAETNEELSRNIANFDEDKYAVQIDQYIKSLDSFEAGIATEETVKWLITGESSALRRRRV